MAKEVFNRLFNTEMYTKILYITTSLIESVTALLVAFAIDILFLLSLGYDLHEVLGIFGILFATGYSDLNYLFIKSSPYIATGLAFSVPMLVGVFNIGGEGQLYLGALTALVTSYLTKNSVISLLAGSLAGAFLGLLIILGRVYRNINEVVSAIMINWIMYYLVAYITTSYIYDPYAPYQSKPAPPEATIGSLQMFTYSVSTAIIIYIILYYTAIGYRIRVVGRSYRAALYAGFSPSREVIYSMTIGGGLAGFGGALIPLGIRPYVIDNTMSALYGVGFLGIGIGLLGRNNPIGIILASLFISGLVIGGENVERLTGVAPEIVDVIIGVIIISLAMPRIYRLLMRRGVSL
ncbi:MAG: ABC transporter permease [Sulfolobales archaeon]|jgi:simple sugar transport system permease protein